LTPLHHLAPCAGSDACGAAAGAAGWQPAVVRMKVMTSRIERILIGDFMLQNSFDISRSDRSDFGCILVVLQPRQISYARSPPPFSKGFCTYPNFLNHYS
jgi:hypothetical protein